jgi:hypothetical protein
VEKAKYPTRPTAMIATVEKAIRIFVPIFKFLNIPLSLTSNAEAIFYGWMSI